MAQQPVTQSSPTSEAEAKATKEILNVVQTKEDADEFDRLLECVDLRGTLRAVISGLGLERGLEGSCITAETRRGNRAQLPWKT